MIDPDATALANLYDAGAVKVPPWMAVVIPCVTIEIALPSPSM